MAFNLCRNFNYLCKVKVYENENYFYFIGEQKLDKKYNILVITKQHYTKENTNDLKNKKLKDILQEDPKNYTKDELSSFFLSLKKKDKLKVNDEYFAIFGFVKFHLGYYAIMVSEISEIGKIAKHTINRANNLRLIPLFYSNQIKKEKIYDLEFKYVTIFQSADFAREMYFSYNYNMTKTLQRNFIENFKSELSNTYENNFYIDNNQKNGLDLKKITNDYFLWNFYHINEFFSCVKNELWFVYFIYGYFEQIETIIYGLRFLVTVIARRNRNYAGTRYLKRGINNDGNVANDVETEQILEEVSTICSEKPSITSYVHIRGSVPIFWHQDQTSILPKPDIKLNFSDIKFDATKRHFFMLYKRYGMPSVVCNLMKKKEKKQQETLLSEWYLKSIHYINNTDLKEELLKNSNMKKIEYYHYDLKTLRKDKGFYKNYVGEACKQISKTNMFCFIPYVLANNTYLLSLQNGVIRSNCVDCLDRTNVYQQIIGTAVVVIQLRFFGVDSKEPENENDEIYGVLTEIYKNMGNVLSNQYAGSEAHKQTIKDDRGKITKLFGKFPEMFNTFKRYFNNTYNDASKQCRINLFLGKYQMKEYMPDIWEIENDTELHRVFDLEPLPDNYFQKGFEFYTIFNLINDIFEKVESIHYITDQKDLVNLSKDFNLDIIQKLKMSKFNKKIPVLNSEKEGEEYMSMDTDDYLITFDEYLRYKRKHPLKYYQEHLFKLEIHSFSLLNFENNSQIRSLEKFSYPKTIKKASIWDIENYPNNNTVIGSSVPIFDESDFVIDIPEEIILENNKKKKEKEKLEKKEEIEFNNYASFQIEDDIIQKIKEFQDPDISTINDPKKNNFGIFENFKDDKTFRKVYVNNKRKKENENEFYEDFKSKINLVDTGGEIFEKFNHDKDNKEVKSTSCKDLSSITKKKSAEVKNKNIIKINDEYVK